MRTATLLSMALLGLLLLRASCNQEDQETGSSSEKQTETPEETPAGDAPGDTGNEEPEDAPEKEKTTEIEEEKDVMVLHVNNFARALSENQYLLVEFYAPWCGHCQQLEPAYAEAAGRLRAEEPAMRLAKVDAAEERELAEEFHIDSFPQLKLFIDGDRKQPVDFTGQRSPEGIITWMKRRTGPGAPVLDSADSAARFIDSHNVAVIGFFDDLESEAAAAFRQMALDQSGSEFALSASPEVFQKYEVKSSSVVLFKKFDDGRADFGLPDDGKLDKGKVIDFIAVNSLELIIPFNQKTSQKIFTSSVRLHVLLFINSTVESQTSLLDESKTVAQKFKGKMLFILIDVSDVIPEVLTYFGVSTSDAPTVRLISMETKKKYAISTDNLTSGSLAALCQEVVDGTAKPYYKSQDVPEDWNKGPVKVLVGKNLESVAFDPTKNVFVEFYAPWCTHCQQLADIWEKLGEKYAGHDDIIIAKMDASANEAAFSEIESYPQIKYFPAGGKEVVDYLGERNLETFSRFLDAGGVLPEEEEDGDVGDEEDGEAGDDEETNKSTEVPTNKTKDEL
ncbi:protein disulfide-isomerase A2 [Brachionichthys hirsutus]|uniref:protein disulfide-isomerase A2 n=1 Tax=Brachionichthys hirsutus TaxID=412623 RepID=UPI003604A604